MSVQTWGGGIYPVFSSQLGQKKKIPKAPVKNSIPRISLTIYDGYLMEVFNPRWLLRIWKLDHVLGWMASETFLTLYDIVSSKALFSQSINATF